MATAGGLEIHKQLYHAPEPSEPAAPVPDLVWPRAAPIAPPPAAPGRRRSPFLRGYDPTVPLTALLILAILIAGIGAAVQRAANPVRPALSSLAADGSSGAGVTPTTLAPALQAPASSASSPGGPSAAIPPAGVQPPAATQSASCTQMVDSLSTRNSKRTVDIGSLLRTDSFPALPLPGFEHPMVNDQEHYGTVGEVVATLDPNDPVDAQWGRLLADNGFMTEDDAEFVNGASSYGAVVFRFTTAAGAREFNRATLLAACEGGILENAHAIPSLAGGVNYLITDGGPAFRASFVAGDSVVRLHICHCVQSPDDQALAGQWAQGVASQVGAG